MKRLYTLIVFSLCAFGGMLQAQNDYTAYGLSFTSLQEGTARSVAMGNALTALGGDLGSINFNPAGTAVYKFSEASITPTFTTVNTTSDLFGSSSKTSRTTFGISNAGIVIYLPVRSGSLKNINFGIVSSKVNNFATSERAKHLGNTGDPTYLNYLANHTNDLASHSGISPKTLADEMNINNSQNPYNNLGAAFWPSVLGWNTSLLNLNATETAFVPTGQLGIDQHFRKKSYGYNTATDLSLGMNFSDQFYIGLNATVSSVYNKVKITYDEDAVGAQDFKYMSQYYNQKTSGSGIAGKIGAIWTPNANIRLGAAISTPTIYYLTDRASWDMEAGLGTDYNVRLSTPDVEMDYRLVTPFKYNFGLAVTLPNGAFSIDYEGSDFSQMRFMSSEDHFHHDDWSAINDAIKESFTRCDKIRVGAEVNATPNLALRAGFQYSNSGIKDYDINNYVGSLGLGYSDPSGFFFDCGFMTTLKKTDVLFDGGDILQSYIIDNASKSYKRNTWKLLFTFGLRF